jgi:hypothetical protein
VSYLVPKASDCLVNDRVHGAVNILPNRGSTTTLKPVYRRELLVQFISNVLELRKKRLDGRHFPLEFCDLEPRQS